MVVCVMVVVVVRMAACLCVVVVVSTNSLQDPLMVTQDLALLYTQLPIKHIQQLPLNPAHVPLPKHARAHRPMHILQRRVVGVFRREHEGAEEDALVGPFGEGDVEVGGGAGDVDEGEEEGGGGGF